MIRLFSTYKTKKQRFLKKILLAFFMCVSVATWFGISAVQADEQSDPGEYMENNDVNFQNATQEQLARNIAIEAALKDEPVAAAIEGGNDEEARTQFEEAVETYMQEISRKRAEGEGWGNIAMDLGVHPGYLGLGHSKKDANFAGQNYSTENKDRGLALGHSEDKSGGYGFDQEGGNGNGNGGGNGGGHGGGKK